MYTEKATKFCKILQNFDLTFVLCSASQKLGEDFAKFCDLLRIYALYIKKKKKFQKNRENIDKKVLT